MVKKKIVLLIALIGFGINANAQKEHTVSGRPVDAKLCNQQYNQRLELYTDGKCKIILDDGNSGWGTYTLNTTRTKITLNWKNGAENRGDINISVNSVVGNLVIEGVKYIPCK